ncbi:TetR/AcrR family transcriptional regulator [Microlunatus speluncae]|uniref:TetR/AcrR family transcriptional regulator n=1 Tax=Microlunatus speluncae TaxID=2594267 RepID=UPI0012666199|nr:TetR/AcrR family transcriptional regulator [Microlunatus speluncae]
MARPRTFAEDQAVEAAMIAFWTAGFEATSTEHLCAATGLGRSSLYNTFGSKRELFEKALDRYADQATGAALELFDGDRPIREKVRDLLLGAVDPAPGRPPGCLVVNTAVELGPSDPGIARLLRRDRRRWVAGLRTAFVTAQAAGEIEPGADPGALAEYVHAVLGGIRVAARAGAPRRTRAAIAETALTAI